MCLHFGVALLVLSKKQYNPYQHNIKLPFTASQHRRAQKEEPNYFSTILPTSRMPALSSDLIFRLIDQIGYDYLVRLDHWEASWAEKKLLYSLSLTSKACKWQAYPYLHGVLECTSWQSIKEKLDEIEGHSPLIKAHTLRLQLSQFTWVEDVVTTSAPLLKMLLDSLPKLRQLVLKGISSFSWRDHIGMSPTVEDAILDFISSTRIESLEVREVDIPRNLHRYLGPALTSLVMTDVEWEDSITNGTSAQNPAPLNCLRSLRVGSYGYRMGESFAIHEIAGASECNHGGAVAFPLLERVALWGVDPWERLMVKSFVQPGSFPELKNIVFSDGLAALQSAQGNFPSYPGGIPDIGCSPIEALLTKFTCITLPVDFRSIKAGLVSPLEESLQVSDIAVDELTIKKLILNFWVTPSGASYTWGEKADEGPDTLNAAWTGIDKKLTTGRAWKGLEEVVFDMGEVVGMLRDTKRIAECLGTVALPNLTSTGVKVTVLTKS
ncbi:hypothetical protein BKA70DRAFT_1333031 [Coprinopsis sp. MPI-PUGE-AT-0042]|nr:hypothetical protein BKA70DRAFT_1333031 [Coprinopsis sp. MPI-PUGE-AT-0042]